MSTEAAVFGTYSRLRRAVDPGLSDRELHDDLEAGFRLDGTDLPELIPAHGGWLVARWRDSSERELFEALGRGARDLDELIARGREARLLVGAVREPRPGPAPDVANPARRRWVRAARVVDWTVLWAGPWVAGELGRAGAEVERIEDPRRRDGLLRSAEGRELWQRLNAGKRLRLLDARRPDDRARLAAAIAGADILITSYTPRALAGLGFDDAWRERHAPGLLHLELVAFESPWSDAPGLGEQAAAEVGLLWRDGARPAPPLPWADPLLGALALSTASHWLAGDRRGGRVRLSLEGAAQLAARGLTA